MSRSDSPNSEEILSPVYTIGDLVDNLVADTRRLAPTDKSGPLLERMLVLKDIMPSDVRLLDYRVLVDAKYALDGSVGQLYYIRRLRDLRAAYNATVDLPAVVPTVEEYNHHREPHHVAKIKYRRPRLCTDVTLKRGDIIAMEPGEDTLDTYWVGVVLAVYLTEMLKSDETIRREKTNRPAWAVHNPFEPDVYGNNKHNWRVMVQWLEPKSARARDTITACINTYVESEGTSIDTRLGLHLFYLNRAEREPQRRSNIHCVLPLTLTRRPDAGIVWADGTPLMRPRPDPERKRRLTALGLGVTDPPCMAVKSPASPREETKPAKRKEKTEPPIDWYPNRRRCFRDAANNIQAQHIK